MTNKEFYKILRLLKEMNRIPTWTAKKDQIFKKILAKIDAVPHELIYSNYRTHKYLNCLGQYYIETSDHKRRGCLKKYRGKKTLVICSGAGVMLMRRYIIVAID